MRPAVVAAVAALGAGGIAATAAAVVAFGAGVGLATKGSHEDAARRTAQSLPSPSTIAPAVAATPAAPTAAAPTAGLGEGAFWDLIEQTRTAAGNDTGRQSELLKDRLTQLSPAQIVDFEKIRAGLDRRAYTYDIWAAATVIEDGCSDDCFRDFRGYLISLGRKPYEDALVNPDSLAPIVNDAETGDWEDADDVAPDAYSSRTGDDFPFDTSDLDGTPSGRPEDTAAAIQRFPHLAARFR
jgi:Protein of unknown function (DUF4240)